jgi:hypothetical protein
MKEYPSVSLIWLHVFVPMQDHERAYFDSADWVLGKVRQQKTSVIYSDT